MCDFPMFEMKCKNCFWWYKGHCTKGVCAAEETEPDFSVRILSKRSVRIMNDLLKSLKNLSVQTGSLACLG